MDLYPLIGLGQAITSKDQLSSSPQQTIVVIAACLLIVIIGGRILQRKIARNRRSEAAQVSGQRLPGKVVAIKRQTGFDRAERRRVNILIKLSYFDPDLGAERTVPYTLDPHTENLPPQISYLGAGITDLGAIGARHREMQALRKQLELQGKTKEQIKDEVMARALEEASGAPTEKDADGYLILREPVQVKVYLSDERDNTENGVHVIF
jgi:hypothetical protein